MAARFLTVTPLAACMEMDLGSNRGAFTLISGMPFLAAGLAILAAARAFARLRALALVTFDPI